MPPVPAPTTSQRGTGCRSRRICSKIDSAMLLLPRQSVARSAYVNWSMKWPPDSSAMRRASSSTRAGSSTSSQRPPWKRIWSSFSGDVDAGTTATNGSPMRRANAASLTAVEPDDASTSTVWGPIQPLHRP